VPKTKPRSSRVPKGRAKPPRPAAPGGAVEAKHPLLRVGCGTDAHPLRPGRSLILGGVEIPHPRGLSGHSDADVLSHAVCDALLGALGLDDMGTRFPDSDPGLRGRSSLWFLQEVARELRSLGFEIVNVDSVILAEAPRLQPHLAAMRRSIAQALAVAVERVSVKAKRLEGLGAIGRQEGIMAQAIALLSGGHR
jgi:2-C-methyl-D-erythritol 2,4-cyclodiphosphate synthase